MARMLGLELGNYFHMIRVNAVFPRTITRWLHIPKRLPDRIVTFKTTSKGNLPDTIAPADPPFGLHIHQFIPNGAR
ncbi:hypothetical protein COP2_047112 [Malus domestica]